MKSDFQQQQQQQELKLCVCVSEGWHTYIAPNPIFLRIYYHPSKLDR
jgi:hypothetical protein